MLGDFLNFISVVIVWFTTKYEHYNEYLLNEVVLSSYCIHLSMNENELDSGIVQMIEELRHWWGGNEELSSAAQSSESSESSQGSQSSESSRRVHGGLGVTGRLGACARNGDLTSYCRIPTWRISSPEWAHRWVPQLYFLTRARNSTMTLNQLAWFCKFWVSFESDCVTTSK